jgi:hypothetical protein
VTQKLLQSQGSYQLIRTSVFLVSLPCSGPGRKKNWRRSRPWWIDFSLARPLHGPVQGESISTPPLPMCCGSFGRKDKKCCLLVTVTSVMRLSSANCRQRALLAVELYLGIGPLLIGYVAARTIKIRAGRPLSSGGESAAGTPANPLVTGPPLRWTVRRKRPIIL